MLLFLLACYSDIDDRLAYTFVENPNHDYDEDGLLDAGDCDDADPNILGKITLYRDADGDGYGDELDTFFGCPNEDHDGYIEVKEGEEFDCDDGNPNVSPYNLEVCDFVDNDCNGMIDEYVGQPASIFYLDGDGDGYGDATVSIFACDGAEPEGYIKEYGDCDDSNADASPEGVEVCDEEGIDENCNGIANEASASDALIWYQDADGDGFGSLFVSQVSCDAPEDFVLDSSDCSDANAQIYPGADEYCNNLDDDCNGTVDDEYSLDLVTFYFDLDGDGFGTSLLSVETCPQDQPAGTLSDNTDCDDTNPLVKPGAPEICNDIDDDCNGYTDHLDPDPSNMPQDIAYYYLDGDGDGHGALQDTLQGYDLMSCPVFVNSVAEVPVGYSELNDDCNDANADQFPGNMELCSALDENCDGDPTIGAIDVLTFYVDSDGDTYGNPNYSIQVCTRPQGYVANSSDCNDTDYFVHPEDSTVHNGELEIDGVTPFVHHERCNGKVDLCENDIYGDLTPPDDERDDDGDFHVECDLGGLSPFSWEDYTTIVPLGDIRGSDCDDTNPDVYPDAEEICNGLTEDCEAGTYGSAPPDEQDDDGDGYVECEDWDSNTWHGDPAVIGGDDCNDLDIYTFVGAAPLTDPAACYQDADGDDIADRSWGLCPPSLEIGDAEYQFFGEADEDHAGMIVSPAGDVDGDGLPDILIGADGNSDFYSEAGKVYLILGASLGNTNVIDLALADYSFLGEDAEHYAGGALGAAGDVDGDGLDDFLIGAAGYDDDAAISAGKAYLVLGADLGLGSNILLSQVGYSFVGEGIYEQAGWDVSGAGDVDGDGLDDILISAQTNGDGGALAGKVYLILGGSLGMPEEISLADADYSFVGEDESDVFGDSIAGGGDIDGDGLSDILVGASNRTEGGFGTGKAYVFLSSSLGNTNVIDASQADYSFVGEQAENYFGTVSFAGDVDNDGLDDVLFGAPYYTYYDEVYGDEYEEIGKVYLFLASTLNNNSPSDLSQADYFFWGENTSNYAGWSSSSAGDVDGDGFDDILIGAYGNEDNGVNAGKAYLIFGSSLGTVADILLSDVTNTFVGEEEGDQFGLSMAPVGDIDGDGLDDILISAPYNDEVEDDAGKVGLFTPCVGF